MATASDNFDRADNASMGANWTEDTAGWRITSNTARQDTTTGAYTKARYTATGPATNDHESEVDGRSSSNAIGFGAFVRGATSGTITYYAFAGFGGDSFYLLEITAGGEGIIATGSACIASTTYNARMRAVGTALTGYRNDVSDATGSDASLTAGAWGIMSYGALDSANDWVDNWVGADVGGETYTVTGSFVAPGVLSGTLALTITKTGAMVSPGVLSGTDSPIFTKTGAMVSPGVLSGADAPIFTESGAAVSPAVLSGADTITVSVAGAFVAPGVVSATDAPIFTETGATVTPAVISGASQTAEEYTVTGSFVAPAVASGADEVTFTETGGTTSPAVVSGASEVGETYTVSGTLGLTCQLSGADEIEVVVTGEFVSPAALFGAVSVGGGAFLATGWTGYGDMPGVTVTHGETARAKIERELAPERERLRRELAVALADDDDLLTILMLE